MSKWNKWKLTHKQSGLSFNQYRRKYNKIKSKDGEEHDIDGYKVEPVMLMSGILAVYVVAGRARARWRRLPPPYMFFLDNKEWSVTMTPATPINTET